MRPTWVLSATDGPHFGPMNLVSGMHPLHTPQLRRPYLEKFHLFALEVFFLYVILLYSEYVYELALSKFMTYGNN